MSAFLTQALRQLESPGPLAIRRACWLTRAALEEIVDHLLAARGIDASRASERAKLSCLEGVCVDDRDLAHRAQFAWDRLSEACHQHAYHLSPTHSEAEHLILLVQKLAREVPAQP